MTLPTYRYETLDPKSHAIRLLQILSSNPSEIICQLKEISLDQNPKFTALSYCWGARDGTESTTFLYENGKRAELCITPNLQSFLCQFIVNYPELCSRPMLWVDAVSINQADLEERNAQVAMMKDIYQKAERVVVWLGEGTPESNKGMDFIPELVAAEQRAMELQGEAESTSRSRKRLQKLGLPKEGGEDDEYMAFISLFKRPWFARVWIIQEVTMAREAQLTCGSRSAPWDDFVKAFFFMNTLDLIIPDPGQHMQHLVRVLGVLDARDSRMLGHNMDLLGTLLRCRPASATDSKDKVFALLGLATDTGPDGIKYQANYAVGVKQAYTDLAFVILEFEKNLDILGVPRNGKESTVGHLPSWVPDWSTWDGTFALNRRDRPASYVGEPEMFVRNATGSTKAIAQISANRSMLSLQGYVFDQVAKVGSMYKCEDELVDYNIWLVDLIKFLKQNTQTLLEWERISEARSSKQYPPTREDMVMAYWQTITAGWQLHEDELNSSKYLKWDSYHRPAASLRQLISSSIATGSSYAWFTVGLHLCKQLRRPPPESGIDRLLGMASNRRLIRSRKGYIGLVPADTRVGDAIALFKGGGSPLIIRSCGENWKLIGDSYVHGMMNAECFHEEKCQEIWLA